MNSENSKTSKPHVLGSKLTNKLYLRIGKKITALSNLSIYYTWRNVTNSYNNNKFKISAPTCNDKFGLLDRSHSESDIQDYFEYILKKHGENADKPSVQIYVNKIENWVTFKIKNWYSLELLHVKQSSYLEAQKIKQLKTKTAKMTHLEITEVVLISSL